jgi:D-alanyl-lipoteichoic acid acyltransferase DltB (MBOAT superfamily)
MLSKVMNILLFFEFHPTTLVLPVIRFEDWMQKYWNETPVSRRKDNGLILISFALFFPFNITS